MTADLGQAKSEIHLCVEVSLAENVVLRRHPHTGHSPLDSIILQGVCFLSFCYFVRNGLFLAQEKDNVSEKCWLLQARFCNPLPKILQCTALSIYKILLGATCTTVQVAMPCATQIKWI